MKLSDNDVFLERINEIELCLEHDFYFAALGLSLTLPDICGRAEYPSGNVTQRYIQWYNQHIGQYEKPHSLYDNDMPYLSGEVVYNLRNSFLHAGIPNIEKEKIKDELCQIDQFTLELGKSLLGDTRVVRYGANWAVKEREYIVAVHPFCIKLCRVAKAYYFGQYRRKKQNEAKL